MMKEAKEGSKDWLWHGSLASRLRCRNERLSNQFWDGVFARGYKEEEGGGSLGRTVHSVEKAKTKENGRD